MRLPSYTSVEQAADAAIGARLRAARLAAGLSQGKLAQSIGVTFQQLQKYEMGSNRISGSRLLSLAEALNLKPAELLGDGTTTATPLLTAIEADILAMWRRLSPRQQKAMRAMIRAAIYDDEK